MSTEIDVTKLKEELKQYSEQTINAILENISVKVNETIHQTTGDKTTPTAVWAYNSSTKKGTLTFDYITGRDGADGSSSDSIGMSCTIYPTSTSQVGEKLQVQSKSITVASTDVTRGYFLDSSTSYNIIQYTGSATTYEANKFGVTTAQQGFVVVKLTFTTTSAITGSKSSTDYVFRVNCGKDSVGTLVQYGSGDNKSVSITTGSTGLTVGTDSSNKLFLAGLKNGDTSSLYTSNGTASTNSPYITGTTLTTPNLTATTAISAPTITASTKVSAPTVASTSTMSATTKLTVGSTITLTASDGKVTASSFYESSDERLKIFKGDLDLTLEQINSIPLKRFIWKKNPKQGVQIGTIAQQIQKIIPSIVNEDQFLSVDYSKLSIVALQAIRILTSEIQELKTPWYIKIYKKIKKFFNHD